MSTASVKRKHIPRRSCVICHRVLSKRELVRIVISQELRLTLDKSGKMAGRGAYLCEQTSCWDAAAKGDALGKALRYRLTDQDRQTIAGYEVERWPHHYNDSIHD